MIPLVASGIFALARFCCEKCYVSSMELIRVVKAATALAMAGCSFQRRPLDAVYHLLRTQERSDGGWGDPEETAWVVGVVRGSGEEASVQISKAVSWLEGARARSGGWGRHSRDRARIPITGLISVLVPEVFTEKDLEWMKREWRIDFDSPVRLSYKGGFFLMAMAGREHNDLVDRTIEHLAKDQNGDGGFGPWKDHPIGSDPWSTGVVLWGLSKWVDRVDDTVLTKALDWLERTQLPSGYWAYHYLDEGTSLALIGAVSALKALATKKFSCALSS